jgi:hypothetical protein
MLPIKSIESKRAVKALVKDNNKSYMNGIEFKSDRIGW